MDFRIKGMARLRQLTCVILLALGVAACASSARMPRGQPVAARAPTPATEDVLASLDPVAPSDLGSYRGGFEANGLRFSFGATVTGAVSDPSGLLSSLSTSVRVGDNGQVVVETTETSNASGTLTSLVNSQTLTQAQATRLLNTLQLEVVGTGTTITQQMLSSVIESAVNNAAISSKLELVIDVQNFSQRLQGMRSALDAQSIMGRLNGFRLGQ